MVLQNFSAIRFFLHNKWAQNMPAEEKKTKKKHNNKKSRQTHRGSRRDGMPQQTSHQRPPVLRDQWPMGWSLKTGSTVPLYWSLFKRLLHATIKMTLQ